jgi:hypothetical protein
METLIAIGFLTRGALWSCYGAMGVALAGLAISAYSAASGTSVSCGCLGAVHLARSQHVVLSVLIFVAALRMAVHELQGVQCSATSSST